MKEVLTSLWHIPSLQRAACKVGDVAENLSKNLGPIVSVKRSRHNLFCYVEQGRGENVGDRFNFELVHMAPRELMDAVHNQHNSDYFYYMTAPLSESGQKLVASIFSLNKENKIQASTKRNPPPSVWIGGANSTTQSHYDVADNVLVQIYGLKRVRIWSPSFHWQMRVFPDSHPLARKAQIDIDSFDQPPLMDIILSPGDLIRIPAFWFHHCEAIDGASISLNQFFHSPSAQAAAALLNFPPLSSIPATERLLYLLADQTNFFAKIYHSRYQPLANHYQDMHETSSASSRTKIQNNNNDDDVTLPVARFESYIQRIRDATGPHAADGVVEIALAHLVELWAMYWFDHRAARVCTFLSTYNTT